MAKEIDLAKKELNRKKRVCIEVFLIAIAIELVIAAAVLVFISHAPWYVVVDAMIGLAINDALLFLIIDIVGKMKKHPEKLTRSYMIDFLLFLVSVSMFLAGYKVETVLWLGIDWGIGTVFMVLGLVFYYKVIDHEGEIAQRTENRVWKERQKMYKEKGMTEEQILDDAKSFLKYHLVGDILEGALDFKRPFNNRDVTVKAMEIENPIDPDTVTARQYVETVVKAYCKN